MNIYSVVSALADNGVSRRQSIEIVRHMLVEEMERKIDRAFNSAPNSDLGQIVFKKVKKSMIL